MTLDCVKLTIKLARTWVNFETMEGHLLVYECMTSWLCFLECWKVWGFAVRNPLVVNFTLGYPRTNKDASLLTDQDSPTLIFPSENGNFGLSFLFLLFPFFLSLHFWGRISLCIPERLGTHYVDQVDIELIELVETCLPLPLSPQCGIKQKKCMDHHT